MVSGVECLPIKYKALNSKAQYDKKKKNSHFTKPPHWKSSFHHMNFEGHIHTIALFPQENVLLVANEGIG
jgi:hypothetical protein